MFYSTWGVSKQFCVKLSLFLENFILDNRKNKARISSMTWEKWFCLRRFGLLGIFSAQADQKVSLSDNSENLHLLEGISKVYISWKFLNILGQEPLWGIHRISCL